MDDTLIIDIWDAFKEYIPEKSRDTAAEQFVELLSDNDVGTDVLESLLGYDPHLDAAVELMLNDEDGEDDEDEDDWGYEDDEDDEDY